MPNSIFNHANEANFIFYSTIIVSTTQHFESCRIRNEIQIEFLIALYLLFLSLVYSPQKKKTKFNTKCKRNARVLLHHPFITKCMRARFRVCASNIGKIHARLVGREGEKREKFSIISEKHEHSSKCRYRRRRCQIRHQIMMTARDICNPISTSFTSFLAFSLSPICSLRLNAILRRALICIERYMLIGLGIIIK